MCFQYSLSLSNHCTSIVFSNENACTMHTIRNTDVNELVNFLKLTSKRKFKAVYLTKHEYNLIITFSKDQTSLSPPSILY